MTAAALVVVSGAPVVATIGPAVLVVVGVGVTTPALKRERASHKSGTQCWTRDVERMCKHDVGQGSDMNLVRKTIWQPSGAHTQSRNRDTSASCWHTYRRANASTCYAAALKKTAVTGIGEGFQTVNLPEHPDNVSHRNVTGNK